MGRHTLLVIAAISLLATQAGGQTSKLDPLPASFTGDSPCADCPGIRYALNLFSGGSYFLRTTYLERGKPVDELGRWTLASDGVTLTLHSSTESAQRFTIKSSGLLSRLNQDGSTSDARFDMHRTPKKSCWKRIGS